MELAIRRLLRHGGREEVRSAYGELRHPRREVLVLAAEALVRVGLEDVARDAVRRYFLDFWPDARSLLVLAVVDRKLAPALEALRLSAEPYNACLAIWRIAGPMLRPGAARTTIEALRAASEALEEDTELRVRLLRGLAVAHEDAGDRAGAVACVERAKEIAGARSELEEHSAALVRLPDDLEDATPEQAADMGIARSDRRCLEKAVAGKVCSVKTDYIRAIADGDVGLLERALRTARRRGDATLTQAGCVLVWNLGCRRAFRLASQFLEDLKSPLHDLRARLHFEIARTESDSSEALKVKALHSDMDRFADPLIERLTTREDEAEMMLDLLPSRGATFERVAASLRREDEEEKEEKKGPTPRQLRLWSRLVDGDKRMARDAAEIVLRNEEVDDDAELAAIRVKVLYALGETEHELEHITAGIERAMKNINLPRRLALNGAKLVYNLGLRGEMGRALAALQKDDNNHHHPRLFCGLWRRCAEFRAERGDLKGAIEACAAAPKDDPKALKQLVELHAKFSDKPLVSEPPILAALHGLVRATDDVQLGAVCSSSSKALEADGGPLRAELLARLAAKALAFGSTARARECADRCCCLAASSTGCPGDDDDVVEKRWVALAELVRGRAAKDEEAAPSHLVAAMRLGGPRIAFQAAQSLCDSTATTGASRRLLLEDVVKYVPELRSRVLEPLLECYEKDGAWDAALQVLRREEEEEEEEPTPSLTKWKIRALARLGKPKEASRVAAIGRKPEYWATLAREGYVGAYEQVLRTSKFDPAYLVELAERVPTYPSVAVRALRIAVDRCCCCSSSSETSQCALLVRAASMLAELSTTLEDRRTWLLLGRHYAPPRGTSSSSLTAHHLAKIADGLVDLGLLDEALPVIDLLPHPLGPLKRARLGVGDPVTPEMIGGPLFSAERSESTMIAVAAELVALGGCHLEDAETYLRAARSEDTAARCAEVAAGIAEARGLEREARDLRRAALARAQDFGTCARLAGALRLPPTFEVTTYEHEIARAQLGGPPPRPADPPHPLHVDDAHGTDLERIDEARDAARRLAAVSPLSLSTLYDLSAKAARVRLDNNAPISKKDDDDDRVSRWLEETKPLAPADASPAESAAFCAAGTPAAKTTLGRALGDKQILEAAVREGLERGWYDHVRDAALALVPLLPDALDAACALALHQSCETIQLHGGGSSSRKQQRGLGGGILYAGAAPDYPSTKPPRLALEGVPVKDALRDLGLPVLCAQIAGDRLYCAMVVDDNAEVAARDLGDLAEIEQDLDSAVVPRLEVFLEPIFARFDTLLRQQLNGSDNIPVLCVLADLRIQRLPLEALGRLAPFPRITRDLSLHALKSRLSEDL